MHAYRHAFCSMLVRRGASLEAVRLLAGHADLKTTQRYVHATAGDLRAAMAKLGGNRGRKRRRRAHRKRPVLLCKLSGRRD